jgi:hypothetical protein
MASGSPPKSTTVYTPEKTAPKNIVKVTSYKPFIAIDEDGDVIFDDEALHLDTYFIVSTEDPKVKEYMATLSPDHIDSLLKLHHRFLTPNDSTILSVHLPQILAYCLRGSLVNAYHIEKKVMTNPGLVKRLHDIFRRFVAARVMLDEDMRRNGMSKKIQRGFIYGGGKR